ncbi:MADS-box transcription factor 14 [Platanthera guangdongensis]|uniref:MADS-box transcription factor 14 n=1 Tax=Platanthera guangdongensis TaxID=2320717 RepID=A0ABR2M1Y8_9ASPA
MKVEILPMFAILHSMERILERYERFFRAEKVLQNKEPESQEDLCYEYGKLKSRLDALQRNQSHLMGEKLETLSLKELQWLEQQLETTLKDIRSLMSQSLLDSISDFQRKEKSLLEYKIVLEKKILENENGIRMSQHAQENELNQPPARSSPPTFQLTNLFHSVNIGAYLASGAAVEEDFLGPLAGTLSNRCFYLQPHD